MTDAEFQTELIKRTRERNQFCERDATDAEVLEFAKKTTSGQWTALAIRFENLWNEIVKAFFPGKFHEREHARYKQLYSTLLAENACYRRRNNALRGENKSLRAKLKGYR